MIRKLFGSSSEKLDPAQLEMLLADDPSKKPEAERLIRLGLEHLGLLEPSGGKLVQTRKGDPRKVVIATLVKAETSVSNDWLTQRLDMGHSRAMSRLIRQGRENPEIIKLSEKLEKMLRCAD